MDYIIQIRKAKVLRGEADVIMNSNGEEDKWDNLNQPYATADKAATQACSLIESGTYQAANVRVVKKVMTFKSKTIIEQLKT